MFDRTGDTLFGTPIGSVTMVVAGRDRRPW